MENLIGTLGLLFGLFLVMAAAVEMILDSVRGLLEKLGFTLLRSGISLDQAIQALEEFAPRKGEVATKVTALAAVARSTAGFGEQKSAEIEKLRASVAGAGSNIPPDLLDALSRELESVKSVLDERERIRIYAIRFLSALIGVGIALATDFNAFKLIPEVAERPDLMAPWLNGTVGTIVTGAAAAGGSSYWHDKIDKVRNIKTVVSDVSNVLSGRVAGG